MNNETTLAAEKRLDFLLELYKIQQTRIDQADSRRTQLYAAIATIFTIVGSILAAIIQSGSAQSLVWPATLESVNLFFLSPIPILIFISLIIIDLHSNTHAYGMLRVIGHLINISFKESIFINEERDFP